MGTKGQVILVISLLSLIAAQASDAAAQVLLLLVQLLCGVFVLRFLVRGAIRKSRKEAEKVEAVKFEALVRSHMARNHH